MPTFETRNSAPTPTVAETAKHAITPRRILGALGLSVTLPFVFAGCGPADAMGPTHDTGPVATAPAATTQETGQNGNEDIGHPTYISLYDHPDYFAGCILDGGGDGLASLSSNPDVIGDVCIVPSTDYSPRKADIDIEHIPLDPEADVNTDCFNLAYSSSRQFSSYNETTGDCVIANVPGAPAQ